MKTNAKNIAIGASLALLFFIGSMLKVSAMLGSRGAHFSCMAMVAPLMGAFFGAFPAFGIVAMLIMVRSVVWGVGLTVGLPTLFATLSWHLSTARDQRMIRLADFFLHVCVPVLSMIIFCAVTTGIACCYALYWLIPIAGFMMRQNGGHSIFVQALTSTFVAHAVGSIIWLFVVPMTSAQWIALIPVVAIERFIYALGMTTTYVGLTYVKFVKMDMRYWILRLYNI